MEIPLDQVTAKIAAQRDYFATESAKLAAAVDVLTAENAALKSQLETLQPKETEE